jgi:hypothetical protein
VLVLISVIAGRLRVAGRRGDHAGRRCFLGRVDDATDYRLGDL